MFTVLVNLCPARRSDTDAIRDIFHTARATTLSYLPLIVLAMRGPRWTCTG